LRSEFIHKQISKREKYQLHSEVTSCETKLKAVAR